MRTSGSGSGTRVAALGIALLAGTVAGAAQFTPYNFTGHWTGTATDNKGNTATLVADFSTGTNPKTFTGMFSATVQGGTIQCTAHGRQKPNDKVKILDNKCNDHSIIVLHGTLDPSAGSITGRYSRSKHGKVKSGTFTLMKGASPSGAFLDDPERSVP
jgi:hypothetical protein